MDIRALKRIWPLAIAGAFIAFDVSILRGQRDGDEMTFEKPVVAPASPIRQANAYQAQDPPTNKSSRAGKANVTQTSATMPLKSPRATIPGTDPKGVLAVPPAGTNSNLPSNNVAVASPAPSATGPTPLVPSAVTAASHRDPMEVVNRDGFDATMKQRKRPQEVPMLSTPMNREAIPPVQGSLLRLNGMTATERLFQLQTEHAEIERENEELRRQNAGLLSRVKESNEQLLAGVREIQLARKELTAARSDLDRLRNDLQALREKVRMAEKEHSAVLQAIGPLLQQLLETDDVSALPPIPMERE